VATSGAPKPRLSLLNTERVLIAAAITSLVSFGSKFKDAMSPGLPQSAILATRQIPFFNHMILCGFVFFTALAGGKPLEKWAARYPGLTILIMALATCGAGLTQWLYPNY
jgi:hypothetical protein